MRNAMQGDKKVLAGKVRFILLREIGEAVVSADVSDDALGAVLASAEAGFAGSRDRPSTLRRQRGDEQGPAAQRAPVNVPRRVPAGQGQDHPLHGVSAAYVQDAGLRESRRRPVPDAADTFD